MSLFTTPGLKLNFIDPDGRCAFLLEDILYEVGIEGSGEWVHVPAGFKSDGATAPRFLWWLMPPWGSKATKATIVHDFLLYMLKNGNPVGRFTTRESIDNEFLIAMRAIGVGDFWSWMTWLGVRSWTLTKRILRIYP